MTWGPKAERPPGSPKAADSGWRAPLVEVECPPGPHWNDGLAVGTGTLRAAIGVPGGGGTHHHQPCQPPSRGSPAVSELWRPGVLLLLVCFSNFQGVPCGCSPPQNSPTFSKLAVQFTSPPKNFDLRWVGKPAYPKQTEIAIKLGNSRRLIQHPRKENFFLRHRRKILTNKPRRCWGFPYSPAPRGGRDRALRESLVWGSGSDPPPPPQHHPKGKPFGTRHAQRNYLT